MLFTKMELAGTTIEEKFKQPIEYESIKKYLFACLDGLSHLNDNMIYHKNIGS